MYKLIAIDMDGTLLDDNKIITARNKQAIIDAKKQGVTVVLASGRPLQGMLDSLEQLQMNTNEDYVLCYNAALIKNVGSGDVISQSLVSGQDAKRIADYAKQQNCHYHAFSQQHGLIAPKNSHYTQHEANINGLDLTIMDFDTLDDKHPIIKIMLVDPVEILQPIVDAIPQTFKDDYSVVRSAPFFLEFSNPASNKGTGVQALAQHLGIKQTEVMCIGDAGNDHAMLEYAGLAVAMQNADAQTQSLAQYITDSNNDSGVAKAIEKFVLA
ncbi:HAD family hydrolase [Vibrio sp. UCD-FRSSP16_10]|uniref:Cof-type HAD-IIB family hydrolase n=1 Tax=unclassified Vibrio TaxID=2614977 RepID=UPI0007FDEF5F|nr:MULTISPECIES: Cof-type HAD-IIB family hydrolase [unclassified Vibrio]OBT13513.1 HAD family hydrolase [Vibrio sp. UCD-FRSSP16_30]OBT19972.1 HAD family hydrolase [Vibrio sp. UCD-FRSSP16_10]